MNLAFFVLLAVLALAFVIVFVLGMEYGKRGAEKPPRFDYIHIPGEMTKEELEATSQKVLKKYGSRDRT